VIEREVKSLLDAKIIVPLKYYEWVVNLVPVRKKNGEDDIENTVYHSMGNLYVR
jgi:hypothetical protein